MQNSEIIQKICNSLQSSREIRVSYSLEQDSIDKKYKPRLFDIKKKERKKIYKEKLDQILKKYNEKGYYPQLDPYKFVFDHPCGDYDEKTARAVCSVDKTPIDQVIYEMCQDKKQCCHCVKKIYALDPKGFLYNEYQLLIDPEISKRFEF